MRPGWLILVSSACGGEDNHAKLDAALDTLQVDAAVCGSDWEVSARLVDIDSTNARSVGIAGAQFRQQNMPAVTTTADGAFTLCVPASAPIRLELDAPPDYLDGPVYLEGPLEFPGVQLRTLTPTRAASLYAEHGLVYRNDHGHILVLQTPDGGTLTLDAAHDQPLAAYAGADGVYTWTNGTDGRYVLFPNVDVAASTATLTESASLDVPGPGRTIHALPVASGTLTTVVVFVVYE